MPKTREFQLRITWRDTWYSVVVWIAAVVVGGFVALPLYYLVLPLVVFWTTTIYFKKQSLRSSSPDLLGTAGLKSDKTLKAGLWCSLFWFFAVLALDVVEIIGPYYSNAPLYFSDTRNWLKYPLILLIPVIYSLILEARSARGKKSTKKAETIVELARL